MRSIFITILVVRLGDAGTISNIAEHFRGEYGMSTHYLTADILAFSEISWEQAKHLGPDTMIKLPPTKAEYEEAKRKIECQKNEQLILIRNKIEQQKKSSMEKIRIDMDSQKAQIKRDIAIRVQKAKEEAIQKVRTAIKQYEDEQLRSIKNQEELALNWYRPCEVWEKSRRRNFKSGTCPS